MKMKAVKLGTPIDLIDRAGGLVINGVTLHRDGAPLMAGDIKVGDVVTFDPETGNVKSIEQEE